MVKLGAMLVLTISRVFPECAFTDFAKKMVKSAGGVTPAGMCGLALTPGLSQDPLGPLFQKRDSQSSPGSSRDLFWAQDFPTSDPLGGFFQRHEIRKVVQVPREIYWGSRFSDFWAETILFLTAAAQKGPKSYFFGIFDF